MTYYRLAIFSTGLIIIIIIEFPTVFIGGEFNHDYDSSESTMLGTMRTQNMLDE